MSGPRATEHGPVLLGPFAAVSSLSPDAPLPRLLRIRRRPDPARSVVIADAVAAELEAACARLRPGARVALTAGSRGIASAPQIYREAGRVLARHGARPFLVAAMGSHGGGTADGRLDLLAHLGVTPDSVGMPVVSSDATVALATVPSGPVLVAREAAEADHILAVNRVKPHTDFHGPVESGLAKILAIGLAGPLGAQRAHDAGPELLGARIVERSDALCATGKVLGGLAVIESARHEVAALRFVEPAGIGHAAESDLLAQAREHLARLPFARLDVLVVEQLGKDVSGAGMDPNVLGRMRIENVDEPASPGIGVVVALGLSQATGGNAVGIGLADVTTVRVVEAIDLASTYLNALTAGRGGIRRAALPIVLATDRDAICAALATCGEGDPDRRRLALVADTLHLDELVVSESLRDDVEADERLEIVDEIGPMAFDEHGALVTPAREPTEQKGSRT